MFMVELGEAGGHLAAARSRRGDDHQRPRGLYIVIFPVALIADDERHIGRISRDDVVKIDRDVQVLQPLFEEHGALLSGELGDGHASHVEPLVTVGLDQTQYIRVIGDPQVAADLVLLDVFRTDDDHDLRLVAELFKKTQLAVRGEAREHTGCVKVIKKLSAEFQIELIVEFSDPLPDMFGLHF